MQQVTSTLSETFYHVLTSSFTHALEYLQRSFVEEWNRQKIIFACGNASLSIRCSVKSLSIPIT